MSVAPVPGSRSGTAKPGSQIKFALTRAKSCARMRGIRREALHASSCVIAVPSSAVPDHQPDRPPPSGAGQGTVRPRCQKRPTCSFRPAASPSPTMTNDRRLRPGARFGFKTMRAAGSPPASGLELLARAISSTRPSTSSRRRTEPRNVQGRHDVGAPRRSWYDSLFAVVKARHTADRARQNVPGGR